MADEKIIIPSSLESSQSDTPSVRATSACSTGCEKWCQYICEIECQGGCQVCERICTYCESCQSCVTTCMSSCESGEGTKYNIGATISYSANGGSGAPSNTPYSESGSSSSSKTVGITLSSTVPSRTNYRFDGWSYGGTVYSSGGTIYVTASTSYPTYTVVAQWSPLPALTGTFTAQSSTSASFTATFSNGDSSYLRHRFIRVWLNGSLIGDYYSSSAGGASSTFSGTITGLTPSTLYYWAIQLGYFEGPSDYQNPVMASYTDQGQFDTYDQPYASLTVPSETTSLTVPWSFTASVNTWWALQIDGTEVYSGSGDRSQSGSYTFTTYGVHTFTLYVWNHSEYDVDSATVTIKRPGAQAYVYATKNGVEKWWPATVYVYNNGWTEATAHVYSGGWQP